MRASLRQPEPTTSGAQLKSVSPDLAAPCEVRSTFCAATYRASDGVLALATDKLGCARCLLDERRPSPGVRGRRVSSRPAEPGAHRGPAGRDGTGCFGFPTKPTPYVEVRCLRAGGLLTCGPTQLPASSLTGAGTGTPARPSTRMSGRPAAASRAFAKAVQLRLGAGRPRLRL
jgi:hypothetical protein